MRDAHRTAGIIADVSRPMSVDENKTHCVCLFVFFGVLVWAFSPIVTGNTEPWDSSSAYYPLALLFGGIAVGLLQPGSVSIHYLGAFFGQLLLMLVATGAGPFIALGLGFLAAYSILLLIGAIAASKVRTTFQNKNFRGRDEA